MPKFGNWGRGMRPGYRVTLRRPDLSDPHGAVIVVSGRPGPTWWREISPSMCRDRWAAVLHRKQGGEAATSAPSRAAASEADGYTMLRGHHCHPDHNELCMASPGFARPGT